CPRRWIRLRRIGTRAWTVSRSCSLPVLRVVVLPATESFVPIAGR
ncbi:MAG: hypothetical protein AVDCRST_MAG49-2494, partial [uncultured Thermomicrobiales bacterium]